MNLICANYIVRVNGCVVKKNRIRANDSRDHRGCLKKKLSLTQNVDGYLNELTVI